jgi:hypothetical protein
MEGKLVEKKDNLMVGKKEKQLVDSRDNDWVE